MRRKVLICDDEEVVRSLVRAALARHDVDVIDADNGDDSVSAALEHRPDLILLDMMMPGRSGVEVLTALRADQRVAGIPVVMLTARSEEEERRLMFDAGATAFLAKPFTLADLTATVDGLLGR